MFMTTPETMPPAEHSLGYVAFRRVDILAHCVRYESVIGAVDHSLSKEELVKILDANVSQGKIPHPYQPPQNAAERQAIELAETKEQLASLQNQINILMKAEPAGNPPDMDLVEDAPENPAYDDLKWQDLKKEASKAGINTYGKKREQVEAELSALG